MTRGALDALLFAALVTACLGVAAGLAIGAGHVVLALLRAVAA